MCVCVWKIEITELSNNYSIRGSRKKYSIASLGTWNKSHIDDIALQVKIASHQKLLRPIREQLTTRQAESHVFHGRNHGRRQMVSFLMDQRQRPSTTVEIRSGSVWARGASMTHETINMNTATFLTAVGIIWYCLILISHSTSVRLTHEIWQLNVSPQFCNLYVFAPFKIYTPIVNGCTHDHHELTISEIHDNVVALANK